MKVYEDNKSPHRDSSHKRQTKNQNPYTVCYSDTLESGPPPGGFPKFTSSSICSDFPPP